MVSSIKDKAVLAFKISAAQLLMFCSFVATSAMLSPGASVLVVEARTLKLRHRGPAKEKGPVLFYENPGKSQVQGIGQ